MIGDAPVAAMIGMCKNAGKTTAMNRLAAEAARSGRRLALTSVGRDGESSDLVTGTSKPPVWLRRGMLCATAADLLRECDVSRELLEVTGWSTPLGPVVVFRARSDGFAQLAGPSIMAQMKALCGSLTRLGADLTLIDGALSRRSPASGARNGCCVLSTGASYDKDLRKVVEDTAYICSLMTLPVAADREEDPAEGPEGRFLLTMADGERRNVDDQDGLERLLKSGRVRRLRLRGALTDTLAKRLVGSGAAREGFRVTAEDSSKLLLSRTQYERFCARGAALDVAQGARLAAVTINPVSAYGWRFDKDEFLEAMAGAVSAPVLNVEDMDDEAEL